MYILNNPPPPNVARGMKISGSITSQKLGKNHSLHKMTNMAGEMLQTGWSFYIHNDNIQLLFKTTAVKS